MEQKQNQNTIYHTFVTWKGAHSGHLKLGNGPEMDFSAPPEAHGLPGVLTPEDAFVGAVNTCVMLMFVWAAERFKINLRSYQCHAEGTKQVALDHTEMFTQVRLTPVIQIFKDGENEADVLARTQKALKSAQKYSLIASSIKSELQVEPTIEVIES